MAVAIQIKHENEVKIGRITLRSVLVASDQIAFYMLFFAALSIITNHAFL